MAKTVAGELLVVAITVAQLAACAATVANSDLESVAKDWSRTIRASQVIPVYPLTEDIQPGDVYLVKTSISKQASLYKKKGFLPLDQLVTRLPCLNFKDFYRDAYWKGTYAATAHERPGLQSASNLPQTVLAPRVAFPTYNFEVNQGAGVHLAIPIQGVPIGLGFMGASQAVGTVSIPDAYTYGIDNESLLRKLYAWLSSSPDIATTLSAIAKITGGPAYLRVVNRVYLAQGVTVTLINLDTQGTGADVGASSPVSLSDLAAETPGEVRSARDAYGSTLNALSNLLNNPPLPGGSVRFVQADRRAVTMQQTFDRPLAIGYLGFDVRFDADGTISAPLPSFAVLTGKVEQQSFKEHSIFKVEQRSFKDQSFKVPDTTMQNDGVCPP